MDRGSSVFPLTQADAGSINQQEPTHANILERHIFLISLSFPTPFQAQDLETIHPHRPNEAFKNPIQADKDQKLVQLRNGAEWTEGNYTLVLSGVNVRPIPIRSGPSSLFNIPITVKPPITDPPTVCGVTKLFNSFTVAVEWSSIMNTGNVISKSFDLDIIVPIGN